MIKKWSYVAAAMLTVASGVALTSCIDNDEPYGIEQIRLATASLLEAKKSALEADKAAQQARIELDKLELEIKKVNAEADRLVKEAEIKIKEAEAKAKELQAQADAALTNAQAELYKAQAAQFLAMAEEAKARAEIYLRDNNARIDKEIAKAEYEIKQAEVTYLDALYKYEKEKAGDETKASNALWTLVDQAFKDYLTAIQEYNQANKDYYEALNKLAGINADLVWVEEKTVEVDGEVTVVPAHFDSPSYDKKASLESSIAKTEREIARKQKVIDAYKDFTQKVAALNGSSVAELIKDYKELRDLAKNTLEQAVLEANQIKIDQADVLNAPKLIQDSINNLKKEEIVIPADTIKPIEALAALDENWANPIILVKEKPVVKYTFNQVEASPTDNTYSKVKSKYESYILQFTLAMLDDNDVTWTNARLNEMYRQRDNNKALDNAVALWNLAKTVYNDGLEPKADKLPLGSELQTAIDNYNAQEKPVRDAKQKVEDAQKAEDAALEAYNEAVKTYSSQVDDASVPGKYYNAVLAYNKAERAAQRALEEATEKANAAYDIALERIQLKESQYYVAYVNALDALQKLPENATAQQQEAAQNKLDEAWNTYNSYVTFTYNEETGQWDDPGCWKDGDKAEADKNKALNNARHTYEMAVNAAQETLNTAYKAYLDAGGDTLSQPAAVTNAMKAWRDAKEVKLLAQEALDNLNRDKIYTLLAKVNELEKKQREEIAKQFDLPSTWQWSYRGAIPTQSDINNYIDAKSYEDEFPTAVAPIALLNEDADNPNSVWEDQVYANARAMVEAGSSLAYGVLGYDLEDNEYDMPYDWRQDQAFLLDEVNLEVLNVYVKKLIMKYDGKAAEDITLFDYYKWYKKLNFGEFGKQAKLLLDIQFAEDCLSGANSYLSSEVTELKESLKKLVDTYEDVEKKLEAFDENKKKANKAAEELTAKAEDAILDAQVIWNVYNDILENGYTFEGTKEDDKPLTVGGLETWLDGESMKISYYDPNKKQVIYLEDYDAIEYVKRVYEQAIEDQAEDLAAAEEALAYYQYQLEQYNAGYPVKPVEEYEVERLKAEKEKYEKAVEFAKTHYEELQAKYDALNK